MSGENESDLRYIEGKKVLVTGASGFVGSALALQLCRDGNEVYGLARFREPAVKKQLESAGVRLIPMDVRTGRLDDLPGDFDYVFSELAEIRNCEANPEDAFDVNCYFVGRLMQHCRRASGIILASSGAVYLPGPHIWDENGTIGPRNGYSTSKFGGEVLARFLSEIWQIPTCILRYFYPYGPTGGFIRTWARRIVEGREMPGYRNLMPRYNPIYISDCIRFTIKATGFCSTPARVINIGGTEEQSQAELIALISQLSGKEAKFQETEEVPLFWLGDIGLMKRLLGVPDIALRDGIAKVVEAIIPVGD